MKVSRQVVVFDAAGEFLRAWGSGEIADGRRDVGRPGRATASEHERGMQRTRSKSLKTLIYVGFAVLAGLGLLAAPARAQTFQTIAPQAILVDADTGTVLFEKNADEPMAPASGGPLPATRASGKAA